MRGASSKIRSSSNLEQLREVSAAIWNLKGVDNKPMTKRAPTSDKFKQTNKQDGCPESLQMTMWSTGRWLSRVSPNDNVEHRAMAVWVSPNDNVVDTRHTKRAVKEQHHAMGDWSKENTLKVMNFCCWLSDKPRWGPEKTSNQNHGENITDVNDPIRVYADGTEYCPIQLYKASSITQTKSRLFLQPKKCPTKSENERHRMV